ncbi:E3 ubiquitin-protein ligase RNF8 isoform X3 [Manduca sexta]|uniref:E3 ubiquitin-protein ligase RNF8 isoform X3 n=1 Tax=Manduca sexta TaxID=7130 RepID=UPI0011836436|nr:E3 ubiquitin-protein ligase RNF8 isoform X3 [Manduca sexta]
MNDNSPFMTTCQPLKEEFINLNKVIVTSEEFTLGRGKQNSAVIPFLSISRNHCKFKKNKSLEWILEDYSTFGIEVNGIKIGKGSKRNLCDGDVIKLEPTGEFVYKFVIPPKSDEYEIPRKRIKVEHDTGNNDIINNVKVKFEMSQNYERSHIEKKIESAKQMVNTTMMLKQQLQSDMNKKLQQLETDYALQIENLKGEKNEVEQQTARLIKERDAQLTLVQQEMGGKIVELMEQIKKHNENEKQLLQENNLLKEKLEKEREVFLGELLRESSSKQDMLDQLEKKMKEQEEIMKKEKEELENMHKKENEQLRLAKEKELKDLEEQKKRREAELKEQLEIIKKNLEKQVEQTEEQRIKAEQELNERLKEMQQLSNIEKVKVEQLEQEREELKRKFGEAQTTAEKSLEELKEHVRNREIELAALAADRIQQQAVQSSEVIQNLQQQLERVQNRLQIVEAEKSTILEKSCLLDPIEGTSSKQSTLTEFGELMESELQCSICAELFVEAVTLNCSHTFCKYCISRWKSKKKDCPICRSPILTECRSLVLDSFIDKMVQNLSEEMKTKREDMLNARKGGSYEYSDSEFHTSEEEEEEGQDLYEDSDISIQSGDSSFFYINDRLDLASDADHTIELSDSGDDADSDGTGTNRRRVAGLPGAYYGGYGRCFRCGARGHWAPGCPLR